MKISITFLKTQNLNSLHYLRIEKFNDYDFLTGY